MKKLKATLSVSIITLCLAFEPLFAGASEILDGRVSVAQGSELPSGLFAKASGYLPGDSITLTNPSNGLTVELLNVGTVDASSGVSILISKEAANRLGLSSNESMNVKLNPRSGLFDEAVSGSATISKAAKYIEPQNEYEYEDYLDTGSDFASEKLSLEQPSPAEQAETGNIISSESFKPVELTGENEAYKKEELSEEPALEEEKVSLEAFEDDVIPSLNAEENQIAYVPEEESKDKPLPAEENSEEDAVEYELIDEEPLTPGYSEESFEPLEEEALEETLPGFEEEGELVEEAEPESEEAEIVEQEKLPLIGDDYFDGEPVADFSLDDELLSENEAFSVEEIENTPDEDLVEENVPSNENIEDFEEIEPLPESDRDGEEVRANENVEDFKKPEPLPENDRDGEDVRANENVEDYKKPEPLPESDRDGEEIISNEDVTDYAPLKPLTEEKIEEDLPGEEVIPSVISKKEVPESDREGEEVLSNEDVTDYKKPEALPESDLDEEKVSSNEEVTDFIEKQMEAETESVQTVDADENGEEVESNENVKDVEEVKTSPEADLEGEKVNSNDDVNDEVKAIVLIPAEDKAPESVIPAEPKEVIIIEPKESKETALSSEPTAKKKPALNDYVVTEKDLKANRYYIQVATLSKEENILSFIEKYVKYPIVLIQNEDGAYKVLVGPLTEDEYGAVIAKFKAYGFKDAFVKSIK